MDKQWLLSKLKANNSSFVEIRVSIAIELNERLDAFVEDLRRKKGLDLSHYEIVEEALSRFLPAADEVDALIEGLPYPDKV